MKKFLRSKFLFGSAIGVLAMIVFWIFYYLFAGNIPISTAKIGTYSFSISYLWTILIGGIILGILFHYYDYYFNNSKIVEMDDAEGLMIMMMTIALYGGFLAIGGSLGCNIFHLGIIKSSIIFISIYGIVAVILPNSKRPIDIIAYSTYPSIVMISYNVILGLIVSVLSIIVVLGLHQISLGLVKWYNQIYSE